MKNGSNLLKRSQALVLAMAMLLSLLSPVLCIGAVAEERSVWSVTEGELVADHYGQLSVAEKELLKSGCLAEKTFTFTAPEASDNLVSVDGGVREITAKSYSDGGYTWYPVKAAIVAEGATKETIELKNGVGVYAYDGSAFSVDVTYRIELAVDEDTQRQLLGAATLLKEGVANLDAIFASDVDNNLSIIALAVPTLYEMEGKKYSAGALADSITWHWNANTLSALDRLTAQIEKNGDDTLDLGMVCAAVSGKDVSKTAYLKNNGTALRDLLNQTYFDVKTISEDKNINNGIMLEILKTSDRLAYNQLIMLKNTMKLWLDAAKTVLDAVGDTLWDLTVLKEDLSEVQYQALDVLVAKLGETVDLSKVEITNPLSMDTTIRYNMSMSEVTVKVVLMVSDGALGSTGLKVFGSRTDAVTMADGTTKADIEAAVKESGIVETALAGWDAYDEAHFNVSVSELPDALAGDVTYEITYTPNIYNVEFVYNDSTAQLPYGARLLLDRSETAGTVYDYTVNGNYYPEGSVYTVSGDVQIDRSAGKPYVGTDLNRLVGKVYFDGNDKAVAILSSGALLVGNEAINVRYPDNENGLVTLSSDGVLIARNYPASYNGLEWVADTYTVVNGTQEIRHSFGGQTEVIVSESDYDRVDVVYRLSLTNMEDAKLLELLNLPKSLTEQAAQQIAALNRINAHQANIMQLDRTKLGALAGVIDVAEDLHEDAQKNEELKKYFKDLVKAIVDTCLDGSNLKLYSLLVGYDNEGLGYYYRNSESFLTEIEKLSGYLTAMLEDEDKINALENLLKSAGYPEYAARITNLEQVLSEVQRDLKKPDAAIDAESANLFKLADALQMAGEIPEYTALPGELYLESDRIVLNAETKITVSVKLQLASGKDVTLLSKPYVKNELLTKQDIDELLAQIDAAIAELNVSDKYWTTTYDRTVFENLIDCPASNLEKTYNFVWTPKEFTVHVEGSDDQKINIENLLVNIPNTSGAAYRDDYIIDGKVVTGTYRFTVEQLDRLFKNGEYTITVNRVDVARERLIAFVDGLNASVTNGAIVFALVENNGEYSIVMRVNTANVDALTAGLKGMATQLVNSGYTYIGLDQGGVMYLDNAGALKISLQSILNAVMNSGVGTDTLLQVMDANGAIRHMTLPGTVISKQSLAPYGGKLVGSTMQLGNAADDAINLSFYITLNNSSPALVKLRNALAGRAGSYMSAVCKDGKTNVTLTLPQKAYEAYLALLLVSDQLDITNLNAVNGEIAMSFLKDMVDPLLNGSITTTTLTNTLNKFGYKLDLTAYEEYFRTFYETYGSVEFTYGETNGVATGKLPITKLIDRLNLGDLGRMIVEYDSGLELTLAVDVTNLSVDYDALYLDVKAAGTINKVGLTQDLPAKLANMAGGAVVVLLRDIEGDLTLNTTTVLNLNGYTVKGNVICNGNVTIVDTASVTYGCGKVQGTVSGKATIVAGQYNEDVTKFVPEGYTQNSDGVVSNNFYVLKKDVNGNVMLEINADLLETNSVPELKTLLIDLAADLLINGYNTNQLYIDGNLIYNVTLEDLVGLYFGSDRVDDLVNRAVEMVDVSQLAKLANHVISDMTNFAALQSAILADQPILSYSMTTGSWKVALSHSIEGDYLTVDILSDSVRNSMLQVKLTGSQENKQLLADLCGELEKILNVNVTVDLSQGFNPSDSKNFLIEGIAYVDVAFDLSDPNYAVLLSVLIANGVGAPANQKLVAGIRSLYETGSSAALKAAFEGLTTSQVITALKNLSPDADFAATLTALGLDDVVVGDRVKALESIYESFVKIAGAVVRRLNVTGGNRTLGSFLKDDDTYGGSKTDLHRAYTRALFRGYSLSLDLTVSKLALSVKLFTEDKNPEFWGTPIVGENENLLGSIVNTEKGCIILEVKPNGITAAELKSILTFRTLYADELEIVIEGISDGGRVANGVKLKAIAKNSVTGVTTIVEYTIIILGDVNGNGRVDVGDAQIISAFLVDKHTLDEWQRMAADTNGNGRVDIGDASLIAGRLVGDDIGDNVSWLSAE